MESNLAALPVVLVLELSPDSTPGRLTLDRDQAAELADHIASDLRGLVPDVAQARLTLGGALFDPVELLRPGFPAWATLDELARRVPRGHLENVVAFGSHQGRMPAQPLEPEAEHAGGALRVMPLGLLAPEPLAEALATALEVELVGRGEAGVATADWLMRTLGARFEHARYLSRNDLLALTCVQYEHVGLAALWSLVECALLTPWREESTLTARGLRLRYAGGVVHAQSPGQWLASLDGGPAERTQALAGVLFELRQYAGLLQAHHLTLRLEQGEAGPGYLLETLAEPVPGQPVTLLAHEAPGLGTVAVSALQEAAADGPRVLAHGYPLAPGSLGGLVAVLAARYGCAPAVRTYRGIRIGPRGLGDASPSHH